MAIFTYVCAGPGAVWAKLCSWWPDVAADETWGIASSRDTISIDSKTYVVVVVDKIMGATTDTYNFVMRSVQTTGTLGILPLSVVLNDPGFNTVPQVVSKTVGARNNSGYWRNNFWLAKTRIMHYATTLNVINEGYENPSQFNGNIDPIMNWATYWDGCQAAVMTQLALMSMGDGSLPMLDEEVPYAVNPGPVTIAAGGGGGGTVDLTPVVDALEEIASTETTYVANNGANVFSLRSKVLTGP